MTLHVYAEMPAGAPRVLLSQIPPGSGEIFVDHALDSKRHVRVYCDGRDNGGSVTIAPDTSHRNAESETSVTTIDQGETLRLQHRLATGVCGLLVIMHQPNKEQVRR